MTSFLNLEGRIALITGSARGIGKAIAETLAARGAKVIIADLEMDLADETASEIADSFDVETLALEVDVADQASAKAMVKSAVKAFGQVDILVNNAGITRDGLVMRMKEKDWDMVIDINLKGAFNCAQALSRSMMKARYGRIINITSVSGLVGQVGQANYSSSKAGLIGLTKALAKEFGSRNITVNAVAPGFIETVLTEELPEEIKEISLKLTPVGKFGSPQDVANAVAFLAAEESSFITGVVLNVDGGMVM
ncbi:MAG: 3-oxoacyl-[acyl-carrier-protein] reductase [Anaerolineae bacterium]|jgi:3-oxoacyl-[acyl-carrier protein] reductase|nr:3-oxoacyl-[acyl-carrier-protein] reductase [Anaerolineae bacterium]MBT7074446.1 3-oxoacyl-[acyl-carrier-protein] reductase [Anaerolineae bacterium]MBT7781943.1 3-oxoacyl-[acyl-carrier-protein] reductase [Anaerolineae bacterium]